MIDDIAISEHHRAEDWKRVAAKLADFIHSRCGPGPDGGHASSWRSCETRDCEATRDAMLKIVGVVVAGEIDQTPKEI